MTAVLFLIEYGGMAMLMAEMIHRRFLRENVVLLSSVVPVVCGFIALNFILGGLDEGFAAIMKEKINVAIHQTITMYKESGRDMGPVQGLEMYSSEIAALFIHLLPAWVISGSMVSALVNYAAIKKIWRKWAGGEQSYFKDLSFSEWVLPDLFVWVLIGSAILSLIPRETLNIAGMNLLFLSLLIYTAHGSAILAYWLKKQRGHRLFFYLIFIALTLQPLFLIFVAGCGIFDIWFDFRKIRERLP